MVRIKFQKFFRFHLTAFLSALFLLIITFFTFWITHQKVDERNKILFEVQAEAAKIAIEKRMKDYIQILKGVQALFNISDSVNREEWKAYVKNLNVDENYPGIQGIGYCVFIPPAQLQAFEDRIKSEGFPDFHVWPEGERAQYSSIVYIEPLNIRNQRAFGYDMFTDSTRRKAMEIARDSGEPAISGGVKLVQETNTDVQMGFNLYLPLYVNGRIPGGIAERRANIVGYVYNPFRIRDMMEGILGSRFADLDIELYDGARVADNSLLFDKDTIRSYEKNAPQDLKKLTSVDIGGHTWQLYFSTLPEFGYERDFAYFILGGGILVSVLLFLIMFSRANTRKSDYLNRVITDNATAALFIMNTKGYCIFMNPAANGLTGYSLKEIRLRPLHNILHGKADNSANTYDNSPLQQALTENIVVRNHDDVFSRKNGGEFHVNLNTQPIYQNGKVVAHLIEVRNITREKKAEIALQEKNKDLHTLNLIGKNLSAELELKKLLQIITDSCTELTGAEFGAFFYNQTNEKGESYMLYTISGVDPKAFADFPMPRNTKIFSSTFNGKVLRSDDITKDPRYGQNSPYYGLPKGHLPVKSFLSVPVVSRNGKVIGGLFFGHPNAEIFTESAEEIVKGIGAQAAIAIDNSRLFEALNTQNIELTRINNDLDNFVYTASHDLKAPVLNIEGLVYALNNAIKENKPERINQVIEMITGSVGKFKETIQALTEVAKTNKNIEDEIVSIDLRELLEDIQFSISDLIKDSGARIITNLEFSALKFSKVNMKSILINLITNAIKYRSLFQAPVIRISSKKEADKKIITIADNGLGIPEKAIGKIFTMFKRHHTHIEGTGIGLYLVKRIVENNGGSIAVESELDIGTTFTITLPDLCFL